MRKQRVCVNAMIVYHFLQLLRRVFRIRILVTVFIFDSILPQPGEYERTRFATDYDAHIYEHLDKVKQLIDQNNHQSSDVLKLKRLHTYIMFCSRITRF